jgi:hypothetical protein
MRWIPVVLLTIAASPTAELLLPNRPDDRAAESSFKAEVVAAATAAGEAEARYRAVIARTDAMSRIQPSTYAVYGITAEPGAEIERDSIDARILTTGYDPHSFDIREVIIGKGKERTATGVFGAFIHVTYTCSYTWRTRKDGVATTHTSATPEALETHHVLYPAAAVTAVFARFTLGEQALINNDLYTPPK